MTRKRVIENSADALSYLPVRDIPANMQATAKQIRCNGKSKKLWNEKNTAEAVKIEKKKRNGLCVELLDIQAVRM